jgi:hypothetical protein
MSWRFQFCCVLAVIVTASFAAAEEMQATDSPPTEAWTVSTGLENPESAYYDPVSKLIFVSNVAGNPSEKDGRGWISKLDTSGKMIDAQWVKGFNAPKGLRSYKDTLWVADIDELVAIDIGKGTVSKRVKIDGAKFLNDVAIDNDGAVYVSDTFGQKIYKVVDGKPTVFAEGDQLEFPNGVLVHDDLLIVVGLGNTDKSTPGPHFPGHIFSLDLATKKKELIAQQPLGTLDGVELDGSGGYYVSDYAAGKIYRVSSDGAVTLLLEGFKGSADIGVADSVQLLLVPRMEENKVTAYKLSD